MKYLLSLVILILVLQSPRLSAQFSGTFTAIGRFSLTISLNAQDTVYQLPKEFVVEGSERILIDSSVQLIPIRDYRIVYRFGKILFSPDQIKKAFNKVVKSL